MYGITTDMILKHKEMLTDTLQDTKYGILEKLLASVGLTHRETTAIENCSTNPYERSKKLLDVVLEKNVLTQFIAALVDTGQKHLVNYLRGDGERSGEFGDDWPLPDDRIDQLDANKGNLIDTIDPCDSGLINMLFSAKVINERQFRSISEEKNSMSKNDALLSIIRRQSVKDYNITILCLNKSNQRHIADILQGRGVIQRIRVSQDGDPQTVNETEDALSDRFADSLRNLSIEEAMRVLEMTQMKIIAAKKGDSIYLYVYCATLEELMVLHNLLVTGAAKTIVETLFNKLVSRRDRIVVSCTYSEEEYVKCKSYFEVSEHRQSAKRMKLAGELSPRKRDLLRINREIMINFLDAANLLDGLHEKGVIDAKQREDISALQSDLEKNEALFNVLKHGSFDSYKNFVKCLRENNKEDVADILQHGGVVARVEATLLLPGTTEQLEMTRIVTDRINGLLRDKKSPDYSLLHELARLKLIAASLTSDVTGAVLYFHLRTLEDLNHLYDLRQCHQLRSFVESVFNSLLPQSETKQRLAPLKWSTEEYERLQQYLLESEKAPPDVERFESRKECDIISTTHVNDLLFEILDMILRKVCLIPICSKCGRVPDATEKNSFKVLASVGSFWFEIIRKRRFAITLCIKAYIQNVSKELVLLRSNRRYLMENVKPKGLASRMRFMGLSKDYGLTDYHLRNTNARKRASAMNDELLSTIRSLKLSSTSSCPHSAFRTTFSASDSVYKTFVESLIHSGQEYAADLEDRGGVVAKVYMVCQRVEHFNRSLYHRKVVEVLNELKSKTKETPKSAWNLLETLDGYGIDCLNATEDKGIVFWLRCRHVGALNCLQEIHSSGTLLRLIKDLIPSMTSFHEHWSIFLEAKLSADQKISKESVVLRPSVILRSELDTGDRWVSGATKFDNHIYVMCHSPSVLLVYADHSPFQLVREIQTITIRKPLDIAASPASNCLYVTDRGSFSDQTETHENSAVWKVAAVKDEVSKWLDGVDNPFTLSVTCDGRVLLLRWVEPPRMEIYGADGKLIRTIRPPSTFEYPRHAIETPQGTWIVCYWVRLDRTWGVCEIGEVDGDPEKAEVVRGFDPVEASEQLNHTYHLAIDSYTRVFVADNSNNRVVLFDPFFRWSEVLLTETRDGVVCPSRIHFDQDKRQLIVVHGGRSFRATPGAWGGRKLDVYDIV